jgi:hypothetical protein
MTGPVAFRRASCTIGPLGCLLWIGLLTLGVWVLVWASGVLGGAR